MLAMRDINRNEGMVGLFKGHSATLLRIFPYAAIKFLAYEQVRVRLIPSRDKETSLRRLMSGSLAGLASVFSTYPLELIRVRMAFETKQSAHSSILDICRQIYTNRVASPRGDPGTNAASSTLGKVIPGAGLVNFYRGFTPTVLGMFPYAGMSFLTHDTVGDWLRFPAIAKYTTIPKSDVRQVKLKGEPPRAQLTASAELLSGALAGVVAQTSSYPLEVLRRRMQVAGAVGDGHRLGIVETGRKIWMERGFRGFYVGLTIGYLKVVPMTATGFFAYERLKWWLGI